MALKVKGHSEEGYSCKKLFQNKLIRNTPLSLPSNCESSNVAFGSFSACRLAMMMIVVMMMVMVMGMIAGKRNLRLEVSGGVGSAMRVLVIFVHRNRHHHAHPESE